MSDRDLTKLFLSLRTPYIKPLYSVNLKDDDAVLEWYRDADGALNEYYGPLFTEQKYNLSVFLASETSPMYNSPLMAAFADYLKQNVSGDQKIYINEIFRLTMDQVTTIVSNELVPEVLPNSEDYSDKVACNVTKEWLDSMAYEMDMEAWRLRTEIQNKIFGESYSVVVWNSDIGDLHPDSRRFEEEEFDLLDENNFPILNAEGRNVKIQKNLRIGDVDILNPMPWDVMIDPQKRYKDSCWFGWKEHVDVDYLKKEFPKFNWDERTTSPGQQYDPSSATDKDDSNRRTVCYLYHKSHKFMPEGRFIVCTRDHMLINEPLKLPTLINNQTMPLVRRNDFSIGIGVRGIPMSLRNIKNITEAYNKLTNQMNSNTDMESPKIFIHQDADVDMQRLPSGNIGIEWRGNIKPTIETPQTSTSSIFNFRESLKKSAEEMAFQTPMVRGDVPNAQLDSFVALQHFEDQRLQLAGPDIKGHIRAVEDLYRFMITVARDRYREDDGRLIKILGKHNKYQLRFFDPINLQKSYDVKITTTGNLANSKAARTQMMITIKRDFPDSISDELFYDVLGLSHAKKFMNTITAAVSSAEAENQLMFDGQEVASPERFEDLIAHWETHRIPLQTLDLKESPPEILDLFLGHVAATEKLMYEQAAESPAFQGRLEQLKQFPMLYYPLPVNEQLPAPPAAMDGANIPLEGIPNLPDQPIPEGLPVG